MQTEGERIRRPIGKVQECQLVSRILQPNVERLFRYLQHEVLFDVGQGTTRNLHMIAKHPNLPEYRANITRIHSAIPSASEIKDGCTRLRSGARSTRPARPAFDRGSRVQNTDQ